MIIPFHNQWELGIPEFNARAGSLFLNNRRMRNEDKYNKLRTKGYLNPSIDADNLTMWARRSIGLNRKGERVNPDGSITVY